MFCIFSFVMLDVFFMENFGAMEMFGAADVECYDEKDLEFVSIHLPLTLDERIEELGGYVEEEKRRINDMLKSLAIHIEHVSDNEELKDRLEELRGSYNRLHDVPK